MSKAKAELKTEWLGEVNNSRVTVILTVFEDPEGFWMWKTEFLSDKREILFESEAMDYYPDLQEAETKGRTYLSLMGFQLDGEV